jgi:hypothetical protein
MANIRAAYQGVYNQSQDSSDFYKQAAAFKQCTGTTLEAPVTPPDACPPPASDEWQCMGPDQWQFPEVFQVSPGGAPGGYSIAQADAAKTCAMYGAQVASTAQVQQAQQQGADWCSTGWVSDNASAMYPTTTSTGPGCGGPGVQLYVPPANLAAVNCFGPRPPMGTPDILPFNQSGYYNPWTSPTWVVRSLARQNNQAGANGPAAAQCLSTNGSQCIELGDPTTCKNYLAGGDTTTFNGANTMPIQITVPPWNTRVDQVIASRL